ncbi:MULTISPECIES: DUF3224 domain-containing protein [unclassified Gordonia (in: high G+C Gram-positive bacteria)]
MTTTTTHTATGTFQVTAWSETPVYTRDDRTVEISGVAYPAHGFTRADVSYDYSGDVHGTGTLAYLIAYIEGTEAPTLGLQAFEGSIDGHDGTLVLRHDGSHDAIGVHERLDIVDGLGTGGLADMRGHAEIEIAGHSDDGYPITFHYSMR